MITTIFKFENSPGCQSENREGYRVINTKSKNFSKRVINKEENAFIEYENKNFFWQLEDIISRLNDIFKIKEEIKNSNDFWINIIPITINTLNWIQGQSLGIIINDRLNHFASDKVSDSLRIDLNDSNKINQHIKEVIRINNKVVTFSILKYIKLLVDILNVILTEEQKETYKMTLGLASAIELGTQDKLVNKMISNGIPRSISLSLKKVFEKTDFYKNDIENADILKWLTTKDVILGIEHIYNKFLIKNNFLKK